MLFEGLGLDAWAAVAHHHRGVLAYGLGDLAGAEATIADAVARHRRLGDAGTAPGWVASALNDLGVVVGERGDLARAAALHAESLDRWRRAGTREGVADALANLATVAAASGQPEQAARLFGAAAALAEALGYAFELPERAAHERAVAATQGDHGGRGVRRSHGPPVAACPSTRPWRRPPPFGRHPAEPTDIVGTGISRSPRVGPVAQGGGGAAPPRGGRLQPGDRRRQLFISPRTVQTHLTSIFGKLGVGTRAAAVAHAYQHKLV